MADRVLAHDEKSRERVDELMNSGAGPGAQTNVPDSANGNVADGFVEDFKTRKPILNRSSIQFRPWSGALDLTVLPEFLNKRWHDYTGFSSEESRVQGWQPTVHPEDLPRVVAKGRDLLASGRAGEVEGRIRRHDGIFRWFLMRVEPHEGCRRQYCQVVRNAD